MYDGHSSIESEIIEEKETEFFKVILASHKESSGRIHFVMHLKSSKSFRSGYQPSKFLLQIGLTPFPQECQFHKKNCFYRDIGIILDDSYGFTMQQKSIKRLVNQFRVIVDNLDKLFEVFKEEMMILSKMGLSKTIGTFFGPPVEIEIKKEEIPPWVDDFKPQSLLNLEERIQKLQDEMKELVSLLPLLYATGDELEDAVLKSLQYLGLEAELTEPGYTADILANSTDKSKGFGFEVTGIKGPIKKKSPKLSQVLDFERIKENHEKTVLLANTYRDLKIQDRKNQDFTDPAVEFLSPHPILLMTTLELYEMVCDVLEEKKQRKEIIRLLYGSKGRLIYERG